MKISLIQYPIVKPLYGGRNNVRGLKLDTSYMGKGKSNLKSGTQKEAELVFHYHVKQYILEKSESERKAFAKLPLVVTRDPLTRQFSLDIKIENKIKYLDSLNEKIEIAGSKVPRAFIFIVTGEDYGKLRQPDKNALILLLPDECNKGTGFLELSLSLEIDGAVENTLETGDKLDIPLHHRFDSLASFQLFDNDGQALSGKKVKINGPDNEVIVEQTDENGEIFIEADDGEEFEFESIEPAEHPNKDVSEIQVEIRGVAAPVVQQG